MKVTLKKPITVGEGEAKKTISEIDLAGLDSLTGADIDFCVREASAAKGESVRVLVTDHELHAQIAAKASGVPIDALKKVSARDYVEVVTAVQAFLTSSD